MALASKINLNQKEFKSFQNLYITQTINSCYIIYSNNLLFLIILILLIKKDLIEEEKEKYNTQSKKGIKN